MENIVTTGLLVFVGMTILVLVFVIWKSFGRKGFSSQDNYYIASQWERIMNMSQDDSRHAILDADKLLDFVLKKKGYGGSLGEKLRNAGVFFSDLNGVWGAHKLRNRIAHELDVQVSHQDCSRALGQFKRALRDLGCKIQ